MRSQRAMRVPVREPRRSLMFEPFRARGDVSTALSGVGSAPQRAASATKGHCARTPHRSLRAAAWDLNDFRAHHGGEGWNTACTPPRGMKAPDLTACEHVLLVVEGHAACASWPAHLGPAPESG